MCPVLGCVSRTPTTPTGPLGEVALAQFTELSGKYGDGWSIACGAHDRVEVHRAADAGQTSDAFSQTVRERPVELATVHLRWATLGLSVALRKCPPLHRRAVGLCPQRLGGAAELAGPAPQRLGATSAAR